MYGHRNGIQNILSECSMKRIRILILSFAAKKSRPENSQWFSSMSSIIFSRIIINKAVLYKPMSLVILWLIIFSKSAIINWQFLRLDNTHAGKKLRQCLHMRNESFFCLSLSYLSSFLCPRSLNFKNVKYSKLPTCNVLHQKWQLCQASQYGSFSKCAFFTAFPDTRNET